MLPMPTVPYVSNWSALARQALAALQDMLRPIGMRHVRLGVAYCAWGAGFVMTARLSQTAPGDDLSAASRDTSINCILILVYFFIHPGTRGDAQVPAAQQRSLARGMAGEPGNAEFHGASFSRLRVFGTLVLTMAWMVTDRQLSGQTNLRPLIRLAATGVSLLPYAASLGARHARVLRVDPRQHADAAARQNRYLLAYGVNSLTHGINSSAAIVIGANITYGLRALARDPLSPRHNPFFSQLLGSAAGMVTNQLGMSALSTYRAGVPFGHSPIARVLGASLPRLAVRLAVRFQLNMPETRSEQAFTILTEILEGLTLHRWFVEHAHKFRAGLTVATPAVQVAVPPPAPPAPPLAWAVAPDQLLFEAVRISVPPVIAPMPGQHLAPYAGMARPSAAQDDHKRNFRGH